MFRLVAFVEDKNLAAVLHALAGKVKTLEVPQPVVNMTKGGKAETDGSLVALFIAHVYKQKIMKVTTADVRLFLETMGRSAASCQYVIKQAVKLGALKRHGKGPGTHYIVAPKKGN